MASVRFCNVNKAFRRGPPVLRDINLDIEDGAFVSLVGPSGSGKSTLLNLVAGFERPTSGEIFLDGEVANKKSPGERGAAMVFQSYALYPHFSVRRNIAFPLEIAGVDRDVREARVREVAARLEIEELLDRRPRELSGGQRQRVALGRALVRNVGLCLFDEPLSNLDPTLRHHMRVELKRLHEERKATFLYVTHDQLEAMTMSGRIVILRDGVIQQVGPPHEVYSRPVNMFVASFIGSPRINLVEPATLRFPWAFVGRRRVIVGIRPEDTIAGGGPPPRGAVTGRVYAVEPTGAETWVTLEIAGEQMIARALPDLTPRSGDVVWVRYKLDRVLLFDADTEQRIER